MAQRKRPPFTNAHVHIFTGDHVPSFIAKKVLPWPLYYILHIHFWIWVYKKFKHEERSFDKLLRLRNTIIGYIKSNRLVSILYSLFVGLMLVNAISFIIDLTNSEDTILSSLPNSVEFIYHWIEKNLVTQEIDNTLKIFSILLISFLSRNARTVLFWLVSILFSPLKLLKSDRLKFARRYLDILEFTKFASSNNGRVTGQARIFNLLKKMYPTNARLVVLPMDMEYMGAGKVKEAYLTQLETINNLCARKNSDYRSQLIPFVFVDPRRIRESGKEFFNWTQQEEKVVLKECLLKTYLEPERGNPNKGNFKGIKIYPALGYYPTDKDLLPLWLYCCQNEIPITSHCTYGTMFYRGQIEDWMYEHPVFRDSKNNKVNFVTSSNKELQVNFTHPLNYLCLLEPKFLHDYLDRINDSNLNMLFGKTENGYKQDLKKLKINFAHFGGSDEWRKFLKEDRNNPTLDVTGNVGTGVEFFHKKPNNKENPLSKPYWLWENQKVDWFSIIVSLMWQYPNVYADISYVLHNDDLTPLIKWTLKDDILKERVLFGTDFYVVRNHNSEKELLNGMNHSLSDEMMDYIAHENPSVFLNNKL